MTAWCARKLSGSTPLSALEEGRVAFFYYPLVFTAAAHSVTPQLPLTHGGCVTLYRRVTHPKCLPGNEAGLLGNVGQSEVKTSEQLKMMEDQI